MTELHSTSRPHRPGKTILFAVVILIGGALLLHWSWNTLATGPFKVPDIQFKHALALELFILAIYLIPTAASRILADARRP
jgi:hypothetical protein